jgi:hypothetical protein
MKKLSLRDIAELIGFASIVASRIFVGLERRQAQQVAQIDAGATRATWIFDNRDAINEYPEIWLKGNSGDQLSDAEQVIYSNLIRNMHTNNIFTWRREHALGIIGADFAADELAWFMHKHPAARKEWESQQQDFSEKKKALGKNSAQSGFADVVRASLKKLDAVEN